MGKSSHRHKENRRVKSNSMIFEKLYSSRVGHVRDEVIEQSFKSHYDEKQECTFHPKRRKKKHERARSQFEFHMSQNEFLKHKNDKIMKER